MDTPPPDPCDHSDERDLDDLMDAAFAAINAGAEGVWFIVEAEDGRAYECHVSELEQPDQPTAREIDKLAKFKGVGKPN